MNKGRSIRVLATLVVAYGLLSVSCGDPLSPDGSDVSRIDVSPSSIAITVGETRAVTAQAFGNNDERLNGRRIFWASQNATVASVSQSGIITGVGSGNTQIAASAGGKSALVAVSVNARPVSLVRIVPPTPSVQAGRTVTLAAEAVDASGAEVVGRPVSWTSSNPHVASVSNAGVVTGVATGQATITATVDGINGTAVVTVSAVPASSVTIVPDNGSVEQGEALQLSAVARDAQGNTLTGKNATWSSSDEAIATVSSTGRVVGISEGSFTITARIDGVSGTGSYSVTKIPVGVVQVSPQGSTIAVGQTQPMTVSLFAADGTTPLAVTGRTVSWQSSAPSVATVNLNGAVTGVAVGATTITATVEGVSGTSTVNVTVVPIASIMLTPDPATVEEGSTLALLATVTGTNGNVLTGRQLFWASDNPLVSVSQSGVVTAITGAGSQTATITASAPGGGVGGGTPLDNVVVTVSYAPVNAVTLSPAQQNLSVGGSTTFGLSMTSAGGQPLSATGRTVSWVSLDPAIATAAPNGAVTGVASGIARIEVSASSPGQATPARDTAQVTVLNQAPVNTVAVSGVPIAIQVVPTSIMTVIVDVKDAANNGLSGRTVNLALNPPTGIGNIQGSATGTTDATGKTSFGINGIGRGSVYVVATSESKKDSATLTLENPVVTVTLSGVPASVVKGLTNSVQASVSAVDAQSFQTARSLTWTSTNMAVATVSSSGLISVVDTGTTLIVAGIDLAADTVSFAVLEPVDQVFVTAPDSSVPHGSLPVLAIATLVGASGDTLTGRTVTWSSAPTTVASVNSTGLISSGAVGSATITATAEGKSGNMPFDVFLVPAANVVVNPATWTAVQAGVQTFTGQVRDLGGQPISGHTVVWSSSSPKLSIDPATGMATAIDSGSVTVTATVTSLTEPGGATGTAAVTIALQPISGITFSPAAISVAADGTTNVSLQTLRGASVPAALRHCSLITTGDSGVATVAPASGTTDASGNLALTVTGASLAMPGQTTTLQATCDGFLGTATITIP